MRAIRIDADGVTEIEAEECEILKADVIWDCVSLDDKHDVWIEDEGLFTTQALGTLLNGRHRLPLPAYVLGFAGERCADATIDVERVRSMVRIDRPLVPADGVAAIGMDVRLGIVNGSWEVMEWRAVLALPGRFATTEFLMRLPDGDSRFVLPPIHPRHGSLLDLPRSAEEQAHAIAAELEAHGCTSVRMRTSWGDGVVATVLRQRRVSVEEVDLPQSDDHVRDVHGVGEAAGIELAYFADAPACEVALSRQRATLH